MSDIKGVYGTAVDTDMHEGMALPEEVWGELGELEAMGYSSTQKHLEKCDVTITRLREAARQAREAFKEFVLVDMSEHGYMCPWCRYTPAMNRHSPTCKRQLALAALDAVLDGSA